MLYAVCDSERNKAAAFAVHAVGKRFGWGESPIAVAGTVCCVPEDWLVRAAHGLYRVRRHVAQSFIGASVYTTGLHNNSRGGGRQGGSCAVRLNRLVDDLLFGRIPVQAFT